MNTKRAFFVVIILTLCINQNACKKTDIVPVLKDRYLFAVDVSGGKYSTPDGYQIEVPAGALSNTTSIELIPLRDVESLRKNIGTAAPLFNSGVKLLPEGLRFNLPVKISIPLSSQLLPLHVYDLYHQDNHSLEWRFVHKRATTDQTGKSITAEIDHFSSYGIFDLPPEFAILENIKTFIETQSNPNTGCQMFVDWYMQTIDPFNFSRMIMGCCYSIMAVDFNIGFKKGDVEGLYNRTIGEKPNETYPQMMFVYDDDYSIHNIDYIVSMNIIFYLGCEPTLTIKTDKDKIQKGEEISLNVSLMCAENAMAGKIITLTVDNYGTVNPKEIRTDPNGNATATFKGNSSGIAGIVAQYYACSCEPIPTIITSTKNVEVGNLLKWRCTIAGEIEDSLPPEYYIGEVCAPYYGGDISWQYCETYKSFDSKFHLDFEIIMPEGGGSSIVPGLFNYDSYKLVVVENASLSFYYDGHLDISCSDPVYQECKNITGKVSVIQKVFQPNYYTISFWPDDEFIIGTGALSGSYWVNVRTDFPVYEEYSYENYWDVSRQNNLILMNLSMLVEFQENDFTYQVSGIRDNFLEINCYTYKYNLTCQRMN